MALYSMGRRRVILLLFLSSVLLITLDIRGNAAIDRMRSLFSLVQTPFDTAARTATRPIVNAWNGIVNYDDLRRENEALRARIDTQRGAEIEARASILEYQELLLLNRLLSASSYPTVTAQVQGAAPGNFQNTVEIDKGSNDGIEVGMPVINGAGLVGKITRVFPTSSIVLLIVDPDYSIRAKVLTAADEVRPSPTTTLPVLPVNPNAPTTSTSTTTTSTTTTTTTLPPATFPPQTDPVTGEVVPDPLSTTTTSTTVAPTTTTPIIEVIRETGTVSGQGADRPVIFRFGDDSSTAGRLQPGSTVETAGGNDSTAPPGIPIGLVSSVSSQTGSRVPLVEVELAAGDLTKLNFVAVLRYLPSTGG
jgi:rod shape-determining protein MreC